ncbi:putative metal-dependent hydrolase [Virgibacillus natechei]|uniref:Metal-dependent hydrolase n=1 Tax=Virgibacillus natechei TaxID=1216297 RepID=A0ABS4IGS5_9BACI|nr:YgjP-like metallopeptidase domain-containing protein [Virgibacillus natechei]MBP1970073.1 putative metal-dependent hydrolase [Virgibacillus natechei]UZD14154.1 M48 family metallopeptidase [Virgibacillus natechei]
MPTFTYGTTTIDYILYRQERRDMKISITLANLVFYQGRFIATVPQNWSQKQVQDTLEKQLIRWYRKQGVKKLQQRTTYYQSLLNVQPKSINLRTQHKRRGTCTPDGDIYINWRLIMAPSNVFDYVIVHELTHLIIQDHSVEFWKLVKFILPDYEYRKEWLRVNGLSLQHQKEQTCSLSFL